MMEQEIDELLSNREKFDAFVYTPAHEAMEVLEKRQGNEEIIRYLKETSPAPIPDVLINKKCAVSFVQIATPNYEIRRIINIIDLMEGFTPLFFEYTQDKFTDNNEWKYNLGKLTFFLGNGKKGGEKLKRITIMDFNQYKGKKLSDVRTLWGQSLVDFHHELFKDVYPRTRGKSIQFFDGSNWFAESGGHPQTYYKHFFKLFLANGILFENYMLNDKEEWFTKNIVLPALLEIRNEINIKPLIVNAQPTNIEGRPFWTYQPSDAIEFVDNKLKALGEQVV